MLSPDDEQLAQDDPRVPGLSLLLDADAVWEIRDRLMWQDAKQVSIEYLRYKPATNCVVQLRAKFLDRDEFAYAIAFGFSTLNKVPKISERFGSNCVVLSEPLGVVAFRFPFDRRVASLPELTETGAESLLQKLLPIDNQGTAESLKTLRYKPERRYVCKVEQDGQPPAVVKLYDDASYLQARRAAKSIVDPSNISFHRCIGHSDRHSALAFAWQEGLDLSQLLDPQHVERAGKVLAKFHQRELAKLPALSEQTLASRLNSTQRYLCDLLPELTQQVNAIASEIERRLSFKETESTSAHGDLHLDQFVATPSSVALIDFDRACLAPPEWDIANLESDLLWREQQGQLANQNASLLLAAFLEGYQSAGGSFNRDMCQVLVALRTLETAVTAFRQRNRTWRCSAHESIQRAGGLANSQTLHRSNRSRVDRNSNLTSIKKARRPSGVESLCEDPRLPWLPAAIDFEQARERLWELASVDGEHQGIELLDVRVVRHKPGRRCLVEYTGTSRATGQPVTVLGKSESKPRYQRRLDDQCLIWNAGFQLDSDDGISVARPWGIISEWSMWFQEKAQGQSGSRALLGPKRIEVAQKTACALAKLHRTDLQLSRSYCLADEKDLLTDRLQRAARLLPIFSDRILALLQSCLTLAEHITEGPTTSIHRDFYPDQLVVSDNRIVLVDFDLVCRGDASLDIGNFVGHLKEMAIRNSSKARHYNEVAKAFLGYFKNCTPTIDKQQIDVYSVFAKTRHIFINSRMERRTRFVESLLGHCEREIAQLLGKESTKVL